jgi:environmental stress-induced protein Ves
MPRATLLKASTYRRMPWKNGGGETVEIAVSPEGAALSQFDWRISMATVATDGPFSIFPGIDRTLSILEGSGMSLAIDGGHPLLLTQESDPLAFAADIAVSATLAAGTITDLNVMSRRGALRHHVERVEVDGSASVRVKDRTWLVLCHRGSVDLEWENGKAGLAPGDSVLLEGAVSTTVLLAGQALLYLISIGDA